MFPRFTKPISLSAPAKINLCLLVLGQRTDGYHELQTAFQMLDLCDQLTFEPWDCIEVSGVDDVEQADNLVFKAASLLVPYAKLGAGTNPVPTGQPSAKITIDKIIPMGAGLGGGSSDAATTLVGLNYLWGCDLSHEKLCEIGARLGADVPVFIQGQAAWGEGIGEALTPLELPDQDYLLVYPNCHVSTKEIFTHPDLTRDSSAITIARFLSLGAWNDCEKIVCRLYPEVAAALQWLYQRGPAKMTGTGSCVFLPCDSVEHAKSIEAEVPQGWQAFVVRGVRQSKLLSDLDLLNVN